MIHVHPPALQTVIASMPDAVLDVRPRVNTRRHHLVGSERVLRAFLGLIMVDDPAALRPGTLHEAVEVSVELIRTDGVHMSLPAVEVDELGLFDVLVDERLRGQLIVRALDREGVVLGANLIDLARHPHDDIVIDAETSVETIIRIAEADEAEQLWEHDGWMWTEAVAGSRPMGRRAA
jgi:hypothetical protein